MSTPPPRKRARTDNATACTQATNRALKLLAEMHSSILSENDEHTCVINGCTVKGFDGAPAVEAFVANEAYSEKSGSFCVALVIDSGPDLTCTMVNHLNAVAIVLLLGYTHSGKWNELFRNTVCLFTPEQRSSLALYVRCGVERQTVRVLNAAGVSWLVIEELGRVALDPDTYDENLREALLSGVAAVHGRFLGAKSGLAVMVVDSVMTETPRIVLCDVADVVCTLMEHNSPALMTDAWIDEYADSNRKKTGPLLSLVPNSGYINDGRKTTAGKLAMMKLREAMDAYKKTKVDVVALLYAHDKLIEAATAEHAAELEVVKAREQAKVWVGLMQPKSARTKQRELTKLESNKHRDTDVTARRLAACRERIRAYAVLIRTWWKFQQLTDETLTLLRETPYVGAHKALSTVLESYGKGVRLFENEDGDAVRDILKSADEAI